MSVSRTRVAPAAGPPDRDVRAPRVNPGVAMDSEADDIVGRWVREDEMYGGPYDEEARCAAFVTGTTVYTRFNAAFAAFFQGERCPGVTLIQRTLRRRTGFHQPPLVEETLHRILDRRLHLLEHFRHRYQPSVFAPCAFDDARFRGYLVRVALTESRPSPLPDNPGLTIDPPATPPRPANWDFDHDDAESYRHYTSLIDRFWSPANRFTPEQRLEGLVSLGLGALTGHDRLRDRCRELLAERIEAWDNERQAIRDWISRLLARCDAARWRLLAATPAERPEAEAELKALEGRLDRARQRLARHRARLWPSPAEVGAMLAGLVKQHSLVRFRRIEREIKIMRQRVLQSRQDLERAAVVPPAVKQLGDDVARHLAAEPPTARGRPPTWTAEVGVLLERARVRSAELFRAALRPDVRRPLEGFLADVEDLYELGFLRRRGVIGGLGSRHGWRLEWLLRTAGEGRGE